MRVEIKNAIRATAAKMGVEVMRKRPLREKARLMIPEITEEQIDLMEMIGPYTMTSLERQWALICALENLNAKGIDGDVVECGVWRGGNLMLSLEIGRRSSGPRRTVWGFDTFAGMTAPTDLDVHCEGAPAEIEFNDSQREGYNAWCYAPFEEVKNALRQFDKETFRLVKGPVEETLRKEELPQKIALLRLDTDWYESTQAELEVLYPRLVSGGVLIVDDYGCWQGAKQAVDEYFASSNVLVHRIDYTCRLIVKP